MSKVSLNSMGVGYGRCLQCTSKRLIHIEPRKDHFHAVRSGRMVLDLPQCKFSSEAITLRIYHHCTHVIVSRRNLVWIA